MNLASLCKNVCELATETGAYIRGGAERLKNEHVEVKGENNFVTHVDMTSEKMLVDGLQKLFPEAGFLVEEGTIEKEGEDYSWIIDPLDGTTNFIHGLPPYAISIGLLHQSKIILGVVYEVVLNECFYAWENGGAYLNGEKINVSSSKKVKDSLIATGFPYTDFHRIKPFFGTMDHFMHYSHGLRRLGSAATDMAYVACGRFDAFYEYGLNPWDVAGGIILIQEAGGKLGDFKGMEDFLYGKEMIASNSFIFEEITEIVGRYMLDN